MRDIILVLDLKNIFRISNSFELGAEAIYIVREKLKIDRNDKNNLFRLLLTKDFNISK